MRRRVARDLLGARAADVLAPEVHARDEHGQRRPIGRIRQRIEDLTIEDALLTRALDVDDGRLAGDPDRFLEAADAQVGIDAGREGA